MRLIPRALVAAACVALVLPVVTTAPAQAAQGDLDPAFGTGGRVLLEWSLAPVGNTDDIASDAAGRLYLAGNDGGADCLTRLTATGALDTSFDAAGSRPGSVCGLAGSIGAVRVNGAVRAVQVAPNGDVAAGLNLGGNGRRVARIKPSGEVVFSVGLPDNYSGTILDVVPLADGRVALLEDRGVDRVTHVVVAGKTGPPVEWATPSPAGSTFRPTQMLAGPAGTLILVGGVDAVPDALAAAARVSAAGTPDTTFGGDGFVVGSTTFGFTPARGGLTAGRLLLASQDGTSVKVTRFTATGAVDTSFGTAGIATTPQPASTLYVTDLVVRPDARFFLSYAGAPASRVFTAERRLATGGLDPTFGTAGAATWDAGAGNSLSRSWAALGPVGDLYAVPENPIEFEYALRFDGTTDAAAPTAVAVSRPAARWNLSPSAAFAWTAMDASGIGSFDVRSRRSAFSATLPAVSTALLTGTTSRAVTRSRLAGGTTECLSVRARDIWGTTSGWSADRCVAVPLTPAQLRAGAGFTSVRSSSAYAGRVLQAKVRGSKVTRAGVKAKRIALIATTCPTCGSVTVSLGRTALRTVSLRSARTRTRVVLDIAAFASVRSGTLTVRVASRGKPVRIEGIGVSSA